MPSTHIHYTKKFLSDDQGLRSFYSLNPWLFSSTPSAWQKAGDCLLILIRAPHPSEPLDEPFEFFIGEFGSSFSHIDGENTPPLGGTSLLVDPVDVMTCRTSSVQKSLRFGV